MEADAGAASADAKTPTPDYENQPAPKKVDSASEVGPSATAKSGEPGLEIQPPPEETELAEAIAASAAEYVAIDLGDLLNLRVTAASNQEELANTAPSSVTVFTREDIARLGFRNLEQLLNFVPGFQGTTGEGNGMFRLSARGRNTTAHEYVLVLIDGQRINDVYTGGAMDPIPLEDASQVEVIRGPGSALYGANAFLGVVNIKTNRIANDVATGMGTLTNRYLAANLVKDLRGDLRLSSFIRHYSDEGFHHRNVLDIAGRTDVDAHDPVREIDGSVTLERRGLALQARHMGRAFSGISCCVAYSTYSNQSARSLTSGRLAYHLAITDSIELAAATSLARNRGQEPTATLPPGSVPDVRSNVVLAETYYLGTAWTAYVGDANVDLRWRLPSTSWLAGTLMAGTNYSYTRVTDVAELSTHDASWNYLGDIYPFPRPQMSRSVTAGYLQGKLNLLHRLEVTAGARVDASSDFSPSINPRAALVYATPFRSHVKVLYGRAFRAPSFAEIFGSRLHATGATSTALEPEIVNSIEVGYVQQILNSARLGVTYFHNRLDHIIQPPQYGLPHRNLGASTTQGLELEVRTREIHGLSVLGSYTHLFVSEKEATNLMAPVDFGALAMTYSRNRLTANVSGIIRGASKVGGNISTAVSEASFLAYEQPLRTLLNCHLQIRVWSSLHAFLFADNLLDQRFANEIGVAPPAGLLTRGRSLIVGIRAQL